MKQNPKVLAKFTKLVQIIKYSKQQIFINSDQLTHHDGIVAGHCLLV